jgi:hypothetical protein
MLIHAKEPPGVKTMKQAGDRIRYDFQEIDRGGIVKMTTESPKLRAAVQEFLRFQIKDHQTGDSLYSENSFASSTHSPCGASC